MKKPYETPVLRVVGSVHQLTLFTGKNNNNTPDGFAFNGVILTS